MRVWGLVLIVALATPLSARAQDVSARPTPYHVDWVVDPAVVGGALSLWIALPALTPEVIRPACPCSSSALWQLDRYPVGRRSGVADAASNVGAGLVATLPALLDGVDVWRTGGDWGGYASDFVVAAETLAVAGALDQLTKLAVRRPRPNVYDVPADARALSVADNYVSFYSGHTSTAFAAGMAYATTFALRHPDDPARGWVYAGAGVAAGAVGVLRVLSGEHFPTDVLAGAVMGSAVGLIIPRLHRREGTSVSLAPTERGAVLLVGRTL
jgi:membrane-associated phospholipid phosphatase